MVNVPKTNPKAAVKYFEQKVALTTGPIELSQWLKDKASVKVIDVRDQESYEKGHIPSAAHLPREQWKTLKGLSKQKINVIYCYSQTCHLAAKAALEFAKKGYPVVELEGGFETWEKADLDVEVGLATTPS